MSINPARILTRRTSKPPSRVSPEDPPARRPVHQFVQEGHPEAIASITAYVARIVQFRGFFITQDDRPDVMHEAILDMLRAVGERGFDDDEQFFGFLRVVTYRRCIDWLRQKRRRDRILGKPVELVDPQEQLLVRERSDLGRSVVRRLRKPCRDLFGMHAGLGMTYDEISELTGRSAGALRTQAYECLKQARKLLIVLRCRHAMGKRF